DIDGALDVARRAGFAATRQALGMGSGPARLNAPPTPELLAAIEALPPIVDHPDVDTADAARGDPAFSFRRIMARRRGAIAVAASLLGASALVALAGPRLIGVGIDRGVVPEEASWLVAAAGLYLASVVIVRVLTYAS